MDFIPHPKALSTTATPYFRTNSFDFNGDISSSSVGKARDFGPLPPQQFRQIGGARVLVAIVRWGWGAERGLGSGRGSHGGHLFTTAARLHIFFSVITFMVAQYYFNWLFSAVEILSSYSWRWHESLHGVGQRRGGEDYMNGVGWSDTRASGGEGGAGIWDAEDDGAYQNSGLVAEEFGDICVTRLAYIKYRNIVISL